MSRGTLWRALSALALTLTLLGGAAFAPGTPGARAATLTVTSTADDPNAATTVGTLRYAFTNAANNDTITFAPSLNGQTITLNSTLVTAVPNLTIQGPGAALLTIRRDPQNATGFRLLQFAPPASSNPTFPQPGTIAIGGLTLSGGVANYPSDFGSNGGGIYAARDLTLTGVVLRGNSVEASGQYDARGGGFFTEGRATVTASTISGNSAAGGNDNGGVGGGFYANVGGATVIGSTISENSAASSGGQNGGTGGGFYANGAVIVTQSVIRDNTASSNTTQGGRGGGFDANGSVTVTKSTLSGNKASGGNNGGRGGGFDTSGRATVTNSTLSGNQATSSNSPAAGGEGAGFGAGSNALVINSTIVDNTGSGLGSGIFTNASLTIANSIVANVLTAGGGNASNCADLASTITDNGGTLSSDGTCATNTANGSRANVDPQLGPLGDNGGPTPTRAPLVGSPAIGAGVASFCAGDPVSGLDQRGVARPQPVGGACDSGAVEYVAIAAPTLTSLAPATVATGSADGDIVVTGTGFVGGLTTATLNGTPLATTVQSATQLIATAPAALRLTAGQFSLTVTTAAPGGGLSNPLTFTVANPVPTLTALGTTQVTTGTGDTALILMGTGFVAAATNVPGSTVDFGGTTLTPSATSPTSIQVTIPAALLTTARVVAVRVTTPTPGGGTSGSLPFTVANALPTLTGSTPATATAGAGDTTLTVTGTGFVPGTTLAVGGTTLATTLTGTTGASATIPASLLQAAGTLAITVTVPGPGGGTAGGRTLVVNPAGAAQLVVAAGSPQSAAVTTAYGTAFAVTVRDQYGNPVADNTVVAFTAPTSGPSGTFAGGVTTITAPTSGGVATAPTFIANGVTGAFTVLASAGGGAVPLALTNTPGPVARFAVTAPATTTAGAPLGLTVTAQDAQGNLVPGYTGTVHLTSGDAQATLPADATFVAGDGGTHAFGATLKTVGSQAITVTDTANAGVTGSATVAVSAAAPATLTATGGTPQSRAIGQAFAALTARVVDGYGNPVAGVAVTFAAPASGAAATFPGGGASATVATGADGVATAPTASANTTAGGYAVVASGAGGSASYALTNTPGPATRLLASGPTGTVQAGSATTVTVTAFDAGGNVATGYRGTLHLTGGDAAATLPADYTFTAGDAGTHAFAVTLRTGGAQTVTATDTANAALTASATVTIAAPSTATVTASASGQGTVTPVGATGYTVGSTATYAAAPAAGQVFTGWTLDGRYVGYASPLTFTVGANRTLVATFAARPTFADVPPSDPDYQAITTLAALGIINPQGVNGSGQFQPARNVARAEVAAFIARLFGWENEFHANPFPDKCDPTGQNCVDDQLWNSVAALKDYGVVGGYTDGTTCASLGTTAPCYGPRESVLKLQVVSIVARAFTKTPDLRPTGFWDRLAANPSQYTNVPDAGSQRSDLTTYRANAGALPGQASDATFPAPNEAATRRFIIETLWQAYSAQFGVDRVP